MQQTRPHESPVVGMFNGLTLIWSIDVITQLYINSINVCSLRMKEGRFYKIILLFSLFASTELYCWLMYVSFDPPTTN